MKNPLEQVNNNLQNELIEYNSNVVLPNPDFTLNTSESIIYNNLLNSLNSENLETSVPIIEESDEEDLISPFDFFRTSRDSIQTIVGNAFSNIKFDTSKGATPHVSKFIADNYNKVKNLANKYGYSPEFVLSIMRIETSNGQDSDYKKYNIGFNMQSRPGEKSIQQRDKDKHGNIYVAEYKTYNTIEESIEDFLKWCKRHGVSGSTDEEIAYSFAQSPFAEGTGATKEEANNRLYLNYLKTIKDTRNYIAQMTKG